MTHTLPPSMCNSRQKQLCKEVQKFPILSMINSWELFLKCQIISTSFNPCSVHLVCWWPMHSLNNLVKYSSTNLSLSVCPFVFSTSGLGYQRHPLCQSCLFEGSINCHNQNSKSLHMRVASRTLKDFFMTADLSSESIQFTTNSGPKTLYYHSL